MALDWENERFVKIYTRNTPDWLALSFDAQSLFMQLCRVVDRAGFMDLGKHGKRAVAIAIGHVHLWESRLSTALEELLVDGCVEIVDRQLLIPNFVAAQEARKSNAQAIRDSRERRVAKMKHDDTDGKNSFTDERLGKDVKESDTLQTRLDKTRQDSEAPSGSSNELPTGASCAATPHPDTRVEGTQAPKPPSPADTKHLGTTVPAPNRHSGAGSETGCDQPSLTGLEGANEAPGAKKWQARKKPENPMPFPVATAVGHLATASRGRFAPGERPQWAGPHVIQLQKAIRKIPDESRWILLGEWLASGGRARMGTLGMSWAASSDLLSAMAESEAWDRAGRPRIEGSLRVVNGWKPAPVAEDFEAGADAMAKLLEGKR